ncbi:efflux RND transporter permease subunit [Vallitalea sp.]|jgi:HAE1 family hydrophobic/amphiphilic exporter-1|uniref:efflux RND transporter permease subunit n=1 Tax=Vallitalea sp. TaxID=1882829 RepID=UPI0025EF4FB1|nr:efflux RND transporter permease subunit [Vallitalea sp.]MCT4686194.1 efflux RND transporter permease subunit [Vallitalea sp.]
MLSKFSVKKPVTIVMIVLIFIIFGAVSFTQLSTDLLPSMNIPYAAVSTTYIGASPGEVENTVSKNIESALATVQNVKKIQSISSEHNSIVIVEFNESTNMDVAMLDMREKLDMVTGYFPDEVGSPMIIKFNPSMMPIMGFAVTKEGSNMSEVGGFVENIVKPRLERIEGVASVTINGAIKKQVEVTLDSDKMELLGIDSDMISKLLQGSNFDMPAGQITEGDKDITIRTLGKFDSIEDIEDFILMEIPKEMPNTISDNMSMPEIKIETTTIRLSDIATIKEVAGNSKMYSKVNGEDSISLMIQRQTEFNTTDVSKKVNVTIDKIKEEYPDMNILVTLDQAKYINDMVSSVTINAIVGAILAIIILFIFLKDLRPTIVIGVAIPISIIVSFTFIWLSGISLNVVSLGGLALGTGMLVDNAVVVLENIYRMRKEGKSRVSAAIEGSKQVSGAIIASTLTTIAVFLPVIFVQGMTAQIFKEMAITVTLTLLASLLVALTLVPMLSSKLIKKPDTSTHHKAMDGFRNLYIRLLKGSLKHRTLVVILTVILFVASIFGAMTIGTELMPTTDEGQITITASMPKGTTYNNTVAKIKEIEDILIDFPDIETISTSVGSNGGMGQFMGGGSTDSGTLNLTLVPKSERDKSTQEISDDIRNSILGMVECDLEVNPVSNMMAFSTVPVQVDIAGTDFDKLEKLAKEVEAIVKDIDGTVEVDNGISKGAPELNITLNRELAGPLGITTAAVAGTIRQRLIDVKATTLDLDGKKVDVYVNKTSDTELQTKDIGELPFMSMTGKTVKLGDIAKIEEGVGYTSINRTNQKRVISVTSKLEKGVSAGNVGKILDEKLKEIDIPDGYSIENTGENKEIKDAFVSLLLALLLGVVLIYMIMASQFESFLYPFIILFSVPLAFTGAFIALFITRTPLSIVAFLGMIVLSGIVVNNGIVLVDYINKLIKVGKSTKDAIIEAGSVRIRPILMTALTTILAVIPISLGIGEGAEMIAPLGVTVIGGLIMSTFLTLIIVPVIYSIFYGFKKKISKKA